MKGLEESEVQVKVTVIATANHEITRKEQKTSSTIPVDFLHCYHKRCGEMYRRLTWRYRGDTSIVQSIPHARSTLPVVLCDVVGLPLVYQVARISPL